MNAESATRKVPSSEDVFVWLRFQIAAGRFSGPECLAPARALSKRLGVSTETVREAYRMLGRSDEGCGGAAGAKRNFGRVAALIDGLEREFNEVPMTPMHGYLKSQRLK